jgi:hypothetical protein
VTGRNRRPPIALRRGWQQPTPRLVSWSEVSATTGLPHQAPSPVPSRVRGTRRLRHRRTADATKIAVGRGPELAMISMCEEQGACGTTATPMPLKSLPVGVLSWPPTSVGYHPAHTPHQTSSQPPEPIRPQSCFTKKSPNTLPRPAAMDALHGGGFTRAALPAVRDMDRGARRWDRAPHRWRPEW